MAELFRTDVTARPEGSFFGGKHGRSVICPKCGKPALRSAKGIMKGKAWATYAHGFAIRLNRKHEPELEWRNVCRVSEAK